MTKNDNKELHSLEMDLFGDFMAVEPSELLPYNKFQSVLKRHNKETFKDLCDKEKESYIKEVSQIYLSVGVYPDKVFSTSGEVEEVEKCIAKKVPQSQDSATTRFLQGASLCRHLFPNLREVKYAGRGDNTLLRRFTDPHSLRKAISFCLRFRNDSFPCMPSSIRAGLQMIDGNSATNFKPMLAKSIYETYCPEGGQILDFAAGFGGRMLGALSSDNNYIYTGIEPNTETFDNLENLGMVIKKVKPDVKYKLLREGSEVAELPFEFYDFAFSSPPYFDLERYTNEPSQCYIQFPTIESWVQGYVVPTIRNIYKSLKHGSFYAVNIADFKARGELFKFVDRWIEESKSCGFEYIKCLPMKIQNRRGDGFEDAKDYEKKEGVFLFKKTHRSNVIEEAGE